MNKFTKHAKQSSSKCRQMRLSPRF